METPTTLTVITRQTASLSELKTNLGMLPAKKKRMTAKGSISPLAERTVKICVIVLRQGSSMKPKNR